MRDQGHPLSGGVYDGPLISSAGTPVMVMMRIMHGSKLLLPCLIRGGVVGHGVSGSPHKLTFKT